VVYSADYSDWYDGGFDEGYENVDGTRGASVPCSEACPQVSRRLADGSAMPLGLVCTDEMLMAKMHEVDSCGKM
jgi:hypothetical protein